MERYTLELENIGKVSKARVSIDNLSVIIGDNDLGKSTICKILYAYVKTFCGMDYEENNPRLMQILDIHERIKTGAKDIHEYKHITRELYDSLMTATANKVDGAITSLEIVFSMQLMNIFSINNIVKRGHESGFIRVFRGDSLVLSAQVNNNDTVAILNTNISLDNQLPFKDVTLIDSVDWISLEPVWMVLQGSDATKRYVKDYLSKLSNSVRIKSEDYNLKLGNIGVMEKSSFSPVNYKSKSGEILPVSTIGDGYRRLSSLLTVINYIDSKHHLILIDEPESGVYQGNIEILYDFLKSCNSSVVITSHSPFIMDMSVSDDKCYYARNTNGNTIIAKPKDYGNMIEEYQEPYIKLLERGIL